MRRRWGRAPPQIAFRSGCRAAALGFASTLTIGLTGCGAPTRGDPDAHVERAAVLVAPTAVARAELQRAVSEGLHGAPVRLADDALTHGSDLIVERIERRDAAGLPVNGRSTERPEHFRLIERGGRCILVQERTGRRWILGRATCAPAPTTGQ